MNLKNKLHKTVIITALVCLMASFTTVSAFAKSVDNVNSENSTKNNTVFDVIDQKIDQKYQTVKKFYFDDGNTIWVCGKYYNSGDPYGRACSNMYSCVRDSFWTRVVSPGFSDSGYHYGSIGNPSAADEFVYGEYHCHYNYD